MTNKYFINGGANSDWSDTGNWSLSDGGAGGAALPGTSDAVFFTGNSPSCTVDTATRSAQSLNFTGYTNTITFTFHVNVSGSVTLSSSMTIAGALGIEVLAASTLTSNGKAWTSRLRLRGTVTHTLADNWTVDGLVIGSAANATTINGNQITILGALDLSTASTGTLSGTTLLVMGGTGAISNFSSTGRLRNNLTINTAGTITFPTGAFNYDTGTMTYTAGTVVASSCDLLVRQDTTFNTTSAMVFRDCQFGDVATITLTGDFYCRDLTYTNSSASTDNVINGNALFVSRNFTTNQDTGSITGTTVLTLAGTGNFTTDAHTTGRLVLPIAIDAGGGTVTVVSATSTCNINFYSFEYVSGTVAAANTWSGGGGGGGGNTYSRGRVVNASA